LSTADQFSGTANQFSGTAGQSSDTADIDSDAPTESFIAAGIDRPETQTGWGDAFKWLARRTRRASAHHRVQLISPEDSMKIVQGKTLDAGRRVIGFLMTQMASLGTAVSAALWAKLEAAVQQLANAAVAQESATSGARAATLNLAVMRKGLYDNSLLHMARAARAGLKGSPDLGILIVPAVDERRPDFVAKATAAAVAAEKYTATFVAHGMAPDFVTQLRAGIAQLEEASMTRQTQLGSRSTATAALKAADKAVREAIGLVDAALKPILRKDPALKAGWEASKRIHQTAVNPIPTGDLVMPVVTTPDAATPPAA
jgi:hypothetical protein